jgi:proline-specific peptidase
VSDLVLNTEGFVKFRGYNVWYGIAGGHEEPGKLPLLIVHGGPGLTHDYLGPLEAMAATGRRVIFYDQLGCGNSDRPTDWSLWTPELLVDELVTIREALGLDGVHLYGHAYGGALALNYALTQPAGVASLTLADTFPSVPGLIAGWGRLLAAMPPDAQQTIMAYQEFGISANLAHYEETFRKYFIECHVCRVPLPAPARRSFEKMGNEVYQALHGPRWFKVTGKYRDWDVTPRLGEITLPTLVLCGRHDQCVRELSETIQRGIPGSELVIFEQSSHLPFIEEPEAHMQVLDAFLTHVEGHARHAPRTSYQARDEKGVLN